MAKHGIEDKIGYPEIGRRPTPCEATILSIERT